jgi:hypothetical protein
VTVTKGRKCGGHVWLSQLQKIKTPKNNIDLGKKTCLDGDFSKLFGASSRIGDNFFVFAFVSFQLSHTFLNAFFQKKLLTKFFLHFESFSV